MASTDAHGWYAMELGGDYYDEREPPLTDLELAALDSEDEQEERCVALDEEYEHRTVVTVFDRQGRL